MPDQSEVDAQLVRFVIGGVDRDLSAAAYLMQNAHRHATDKGRLPEDIWKVLNNQLQKVAVYVEVTKNQLNLELPRYVRGPAGHPFASVSVALNLVDFHANQAIYAANEFDKGELATHTTKWLEAVGLIFERITELYQEHRDPYQENRDPTGPDRTI